MVAINMPPVKRNKVETKVPQKQPKVELGQSVERVRLTDEIVKNIRKNLAICNDSEVLRLFGNLHYADQALVFRDIKNDQHAQLIHIIKSCIEPELLVELTPNLKLRFVKTLGFSTVGRMMEELSSEEAVSFLHSFSRSDQVALLKRTKLEKRKLIRNTMNRPEDTAGYIMEASYITVKQDDTLADAISHLRTIELENHVRVYDIFVTGQNGEIVGMVETTSLLTEEPTMAISEVMKKNFLSVRTNDSTREVVHLFNKYDLNTVPVLDENDCVIGSISIDVVRYIADEQSEEEILKMSGALSDMDESFYHTVKVRFVWLFINLLTTAASSLVIAHYEHTVSNIVALAILIPTTVSMGSNAGTQTVTVIIRALATQQLSKSTFKAYFNREMLMSVVNAIAFGMICFTSVYFIYSQASLALVFAIAISVTLVFSALSGILTPVVMKALGTDPAITSVVFLTAIVDIVAFFSLLGLASAFLLG